GGNGNGGGGGSATTSAPTTQAGTQTSGGGGKSVTVTMKNIQFAPKSLTVAKGTTVVWRNEDAVPHDVTKTGGPGSSFSSGTGNLQQGDTYKQTLSTPGKISYVCTIHPGMEGTITVK
ncbi:MAG: cupredoxin domain-containing protein, partial [Thermoleophilaceae bacterium]|nr:cupredoxin domain-containing protein [Thermoleophilaceae bacterium]